MRAVRGVPRFLGGVFVVVAAGLLFLDVGVFIARSGSMAPAIRAGDVVVSRPVPVGSIAQDDVVTFRDPSRGGRLVTHRVTSVASAGDERRLTTKGDANTTTETWQRAADERVGRMLLRVPALGRVLAFAPAGRVAFGLAAVGLGLAARDQVRRRRARTPPSQRSGWSQPVHAG